MNKNTEKMFDNILHGKRITGDVLKYVNVDDIKKNLENLNNVKILERKWSKEKRYTINVETDYNNHILGFLRNLNKECNDEIKNEFIESWKHLVNGNKDSNFKYNQIKHFDGIDFKFNIVDSLIFINRWLFDLNEKNLLEDDMDVVIKFGEALSNLKDIDNVDDDFKSHCYKMIYLIHSNLYNQDTIYDPNLIVNLDIIELKYNICYNKIVQYSNELEKLYFEYGKQIYLNNKLKEQKIVFEFENEFESKISNLLFEMGYEFFTINKFVNGTFMEFLSDKSPKLDEIFNMYCKFLNMKNKEYEDKYNKITSDSFVESSFNDLNEILYKRNLDSATLYKLTDLKNKINTILENQKK